MKKPGAFLDRDGVINVASVNNGNPIPPKNISELIILEGVIEAIQILFDNGFIPVVVTNQPDIVRKITTRREVDLLNAEISKITGLEHFYICDHDDEVSCNCRKPKTGLLEKSAFELDIDKRQSFLVGDRWRDIEAGQRFGIKSYFIDNSYNEKQPKEPFIRVSSLLEAVQLEFGV